jgi:hypothetical protein
MEQGARRRFQFSLRSLLVTIVVVAFLLAPLAWVIREKRLQMLLARAELMQALAAERRAMLANQSARAILDQTASRADEAGVSNSGSKSVVSQRGSALADVAPPSLVKELQRENAELKEKVELLRREVERLKATSGR